MFLNKFALTLKVLHKPPSCGELFSLLRYFLDSRAGIADQRRILRLMTIDIELTLDHYVQICALRLRQVIVGGFYSLLSLPIDFGFFSSSVHSPNCPQIQWFRVIRQFSCEHHKSRGVHSLALRSCAPFSVRDLKARKWMIIFGS